MPAASRLPRLSLGDLTLMRRAQILEYLLADATLLVALITPDPDTSDHRAFVVLGIVNLAAALALIVAPPSRVLNLGGLVLGILMVSACVAVSHPTGAGPFFYLWPMLTIAYFLGRRALVAGTLLMAVTYAAALLYTHPPVAQMLFSGVLISVIAVSALVRLLREQLDRAMEALHHAASTDPLTVLANRAAFTATYARESARSRRLRSTVAIALFDLDNFKDVNDRFGHVAGDAALVRFAGILRDECRGCDLPARIGGEEFAVVLADGTTDGARIFAARVAERLARETASERVALSVSGGVSSGPGTDSLTELLHQADRALYRAKAAGRRRVEVAVESDRRLAA